MFVPMFKNIFCFFYFKVQSKEMASTESQTDAAPEGELWSSTVDATAAGLQVNGEEVTPAPNLLEELQKKVTELEDDKKEKEGQIAEMQE